MKKRFRVNPFAVAAGILHAVAPAAFPAFSAIFHSVSAFCNAGFSLYADSLVGFRGDWRINILIMALIISALMFIGRLGPILLVTAIQGYQKKQRYYWSEENFMIG